MDDKTEIAPQKYVRDWKSIRPMLDSADAQEWVEAIAILEARITSRFLRPIAAIEKIGYSGFAIMTLDCLLIDTIQSFREGRQDGSEESTATSFKKFLTKSRHFRQYFQAQDAKSFFSNVRCGLMHDGETRSGWRVRTDTSELLSRDPASRDRIVNRKLFHQGILREFADLIDELRRGETLNLRKNFLKRMDGICGT